MLLLFFKQNLKIHLLLHFFWVSPNTSALFWWLLILFPPLLHLQFANIKALAKRNRYWLRLAKLWFQWAALIYAHIDWSYLSPSNTLVSSLLLAGWWLEHACLRKAWSISLQDSSIAIYLDSPWGFKQSTKSHYCPSGCDCAVAEMMPACDIQSTRPVFRSPVLLNSCWFNF